MRRSDPSGAGLPAAVLEGGEDCGPGRPGYDGTILQGEQGRDTLHSEPARRLGLVSTLIVTKRALGSSSFAVRSKIGAIAEAA